jgi:crotonobetainyl-CoA:carnitine CoA-transferase CaiB-like acyl-CoA transferase
MIEHPKGGDPMRLRSAGFFECVNKGKKSICIDLSKQEGRSLCYQLVTTSHIYIEGFRPGKAKKLGIDYNTIKGVNEKIIYTSISGFGQTGPCRDIPRHDLNYQSLAGMFLKHIKENQTHFTAPLIPVSDFSSAMFATIGIFGCILFHKNANMENYINTSMFDGLLSWMSIWLTDKGNDDQLQNENEPAITFFKQKVVNILLWGLHMKIIFGNGFVRRSETKRWQELNIMKGSLVLMR